MPKTINLAEKLEQFSDQWAPRIAARYNGNEVRLAKVEGEFHWHSHAETDELFLVVSGALDLEFRGHTEHLSAGEMIVVPRGTEHRPCAREGEAHLLIMDAAGTSNTGDAATAFKAIEV